MRSIALGFLLLTCWGLMPGTPGLYGESSESPKGCEKYRELGESRQCDPYHIPLLKVDSTRLIPRSASHTLHAPRPFSQVMVSHPGPGDWVEGYMAYEESILRPTPPRKREPNRTGESSRRPEKSEELSKSSVKSPSPKAASSMPRKGSKARSVPAGLPSGKKSFQGGDRAKKPAPSKTSGKKAPPPEVPGTVSMPEKLTHIVRPGETLLGLARRYDTTLFDIRRWNRLSRDHLLKVGEKLTIHPGKRTPKEKIAEALRRERYGRYKVEKGDTLITLAKRFGVKVEEIRKLNPELDGHRIRVGERLMLPLEQEKIDKMMRRYRRSKFAFAGKGRFKHKIRVTATAYTSHPGQTDNTPFLAAWNNRIRPGMKIIAVSPDLIRKYGITNGTRVKISGLPGVYTVRDKMNKRLRNHIDIYMGTDRRKALRWGRRRVILYW